MKVLVFLLEVFPIEYVEGFVPLFFGRLCDNLGIDYEKHEQELCRFLTLFNDILDIIYDF